MERILAFEVNGNADKIVKCLNHFTKKFGLSAMHGNADDHDWYYIAYDTATYEITKYGCREKPGGEGVILFHDLPNFMRFPLDIQIEAVEKSKSKSPIPFILNIYVGSSGGGFDWGKTSEGHDFWNEVLVNLDTDLFYKQFKTKEHESRLQEQESPLRGDSGEVKCGICRRKHKPRVTVSSLGYQEVTGRG